MSFLATIKAAQQSAGQQSSLSSASPRDSLMNTSFLKKKAHEMKSRVTSSKDSRIVELGARNIAGVSDEESLGPAILAVPLREMILALYKHNRDRQIYSGIGHVIFMVCLLYVILNNYRVQNAAETNLGLADTFLDSPIAVGQYKMSWNTGSVNDVPTFFSWMTNIAIPAVFPPVVGGQPLTLNSNLRVVGGARLRQVRVHKYSCRTEMMNSGPRFANKDETCYGVYSAANEEMEPYGRNNRFVRTTGYSSLSGVYGWQPGGSTRNYGNGGFVEFLNASHTAVSALAYVNNLLADGWVDSGTRIIAFDFNVYNTAKQALTSCSFMFEIYPSGYGNENYRIYTFDFAGDSDMKRLLLYVESIVVVIVFFKVISIFFQIGSVMRTWIVKNSGGPVFTLVTSLSFWFDIFEIMVYVTVGGLWISYYADSELNDFSSYDSKYTDIIAVARLHVNMVSFGGLAVAVSVLKLFRYLSLDSRMSIVWQTLYIASGEIISITITVFILIIGFAFLGNMLFGADVRSFHSIESSISTLFQMALGSFDYEPMTRARPDVTGIFFGAYICSVYLIAFNIIVGALTTYYTVVHDSLKIEGQWKKSAVTFESQFLARFIILSEYPSYWLFAFRILIANEIYVQFLVPVVRIFMPNYNPDDTESEKLILAHTLRSSSFSLRSVTVTVNPLAPPVASTSSSATAPAPSSSPSTSSKPATATAAAAATTAANALSESVILQHIESWAADDRFERAVLEVYFAGKKERGFDLYEYLDDFTSRVAAWDSLYISLHELCSLTSANACKMGTHFPTNCVARRLMDAYAASKRCTLVGGISGAKKHTPSRVYTSSDAVRFASFKVSKLNRFGRMQARNLIIDSEQYAIVDLDLNGRVCKKLPLVQLCMIERPMANPKCLVLCFSSSGDHVRRLGQGGRGEEELFELLETTWTIICNSNEEREELHAELMRLFALLPYALSGLGGADSKLAASSESLKGPTLLGRSKASTKPSTVAHVLNKANVSVANSSQPARSSSEPRTSSGSSVQSSATASQSLTSDMTGAELADLTLSRMHKRVRTPSFTSRVLGSAREDFQGAVQITAAISKELSDKRKTASESPTLSSAPAPPPSIPTLTPDLPINLNNASGEGSSSSQPLSSLSLTSSSSSSSLSSLAETSTTSAKSPLPKRVSMGMLSAKGLTKTVSFGK